MRSKLPCQKDTASKIQNFSGGKSKASPGFIKSLRNTSMDSQSSVKQRKKPIIIKKSSKKPRDVRVSFESANHSLFKTHYNHLRPLPSDYLLHEVAPGDKVKVHLANTGSSGVRIAYLRSDLEKGNFLADIYRIGSPFPDHKAVPVSVVNIIEIVEHSSKNWSKEQEEQDNTSTIVAKMKEVPHDKLLAAQGLPPLPGSQRQPATGYAIVRDVPTQGQGAVFYLMRLSWKAGDAYWGTMIACDGPGANNPNVKSDAPLTFCKKSIISLHSDYSSAIDGLFRVSDNG